MPRRRSLVVVLLLAVAAVMTIAPMRGAFDGGPRDDHREHSLDASVERIDPSVARVADSQRHRPGVPERFVLQRLLLGIAIVAAIVAFDLARRDAARPVAQVARSQWRGTPARSRGPPAHVG